MIHLSKFNTNKVIDVSQGLKQIQGFCEPICYLCSLDLNKEVSVAVSHTFRTDLNCSLCGKVLEEDKILNAIHKCD